jgi:hypothetical protein
MILPEFSPDTPSNHYAIALRTQRTIPYCPTPTPSPEYPYSPQTSTTADPPPLPHSRSGRPRNPIIRFAFTLRSLSEITTPPTPTSHPPPSLFTPKPTPILMKSHAAPNSESKPLFYPEGTYEPLATPRHPKHSPDPFPPPPALSNPSTPSNRKHLRFRV